MIKISKSSYLKFNNIKFKCAIGKNGIKSNKTEGDKSTPSGSYKIISIYYRKDRIKNLRTTITKKSIKKNMGWCDDISSENYNKLVKIPYEFSFEKLYRKDHLYDIICVLNYNTCNIKKNKGSAIFIHLANSKYKPTNGCIALKKKI